MTEIKDFSKPRRALQFRIDDDLFSATPVIPAQVMLDFTKQITEADPTRMSPAAQVQILSGMLAIVLEPESLKRFEARMADVRNPIDMEQINSVVTWLFEEYGMRPTVESSPSLSGDSLPAYGTTSTENTQGVVSTSEASPLISS